MKNIVLYFISLLFYGTVFSQLSAEQLLNDFNKLNWLEGIWERTNAKPGNTGMEKWVKQSKDVWWGLGISMKGNDTLFAEKLKLVIKDGFIYYVADVPENKQPVYFKMTEITSNGFTCENPEHDFPEKINYHLDGSKLSAVISGKGRSITFTFEKKKPD